MDGQRFRIKWYKCNNNWLNSKKRNWLICLIMDTNSSVKSVLLYKYIHKIEEVDNVHVLEKYQFLGGCVIGDTNTYLYMDLKDKKVSGYFYRSEKDWIPFDKNIKLSRIVNNEEKKYVLGYIEKMACLSKKIKYEENKPSINEASNLLNIFRGHAKEDKAIKLIKREENPRVIKARFIGKERDD